MTKTRHRQAVESDGLKRWFSLVVVFREKSCTGLDRAGSGSWKQALSISKCWHFCGRSVKRQRVAVGLGSGFHPKKGAETAGLAGEPKLIKNFKGMENPNTHTQSQAFRPGEIWRDNEGVHLNAHSGGILFHEGVYFWFGEHKIEGDAGNYAHVGVGVYSSKDLYNWKNEGIALHVSENPARPLQPGCIIERPKVLFNPTTRKFVMWFHHELAGHGYGTSLSGVAVADEVAGPYTYLESFRPNAGVWPLNFPHQLREPLGEEDRQKLADTPMPGNMVPEWARDMLVRRDFEGGQMARDMTLFLDDDGKAYHVYSSEENATLHLSLLSDDFLKPAGKYVRIFPLGFNEAPAIFKRHGRYFLMTSGCTGWAPNAARLASADDILGPWTSLGNPVRGTAEQMESTFDSQSTFVLPVQGMSDALVFMADRWMPENAIDGRYIWLPVRFDSRGNPFLEWEDEWNLECL